MDEFKQNLQSALNHAYFFLKFRPRSKREMADYFAKKARRFKWPAEIIGKAIIELEEEGLVDDGKFVEWFVSAKSKVKAKSEKLLRQELQKFGIDKFIVEDFFAQNPIDEEEAIKKLLERKWSSWSRFDKRERFKKAVAFLQRRGFNYSQIKKAISAQEQ